MVIFEQHFQLLEDLDQGQGLEVQGQDQELGTQGQGQGQGDCQLASRPRPEDSGCDYCKWYVVVDRSCRPRPLKHFCLHSSYNYCLTQTWFLSSYPSAVFGVVILSVRPSVRLSHACFVTKSDNALRIF